MHDENLLAADELRAQVTPNSYRPPPQPAGLIARDDLVGGLVETPRRHLVVVTAPAGFGKTTTVSLWDQADERPFAWVHLGDLDNDPVHLLRHVALAIDQVKPLDERLTRLLTGAGRSPDLDIVPALVRALADRGPLVLVFDDIHLVTTAAALRALMGLVAGRTDTTQLVLLGRSTPHLPLARHSMSPGVLELAAEDLVMDVEEAAQVFEGAGVELTGTAIEDLVRETEGWPAGLHMAALRLSGGARSDEGLTLTGRDRMVGDYLFQEVLEAQPADVIDFLQRSAVLDPMSAEVLDELLERNDSAQKLDQIERSGNMFLVALDRERHWYRYHHLFGEMLRDRLRRTAPDLTRDLDLRASRLLERRGDVDSAIRHAMRSGEVGRASDLIFARTAEMATKGRVALLGRWLELVGTDAMDQHVSAALAWGWYGDLAGDLDVFKRALAAADGMDDAGPLADGSPSVGVALAVLRSMGGWDGLDGVIRDTQIVRDGGLLPENPWWSVGTVVQGTAYSMVGEPHLARQRFSEALEVTSNAPALEAPVQAHLALLALEEDDLAEADRLATIALGLMTAHNLEGVLPTVAVYPVVALVAARHGRRVESERAGSAGRRMVARLQYLAPRSALQANLLLARAALALGDLGQARTSAREAERARRREPSAVHLNEQLDDLLERLHGADGEVAMNGQSLTAAQLRVLGYLPTHLSIQEIADQLSVSRNTAKSHTVAVYDKLGVSSRSGAVSEARRLGLLSA